MRRRRSGACPDLPVRQINVPLAKPAKLIG